MPTTTAHKDFTSVALVSSAPMVAVVPAALPVTDLKSFVEYARKNPVSYASAGVGSFGQLATELLASKAGVKMTHIPYKGQGPTTTAVIAGEVQLLVTTPSAAMNEFIAQKRLKLLAVTSAEPSPLEPGTPTIGSVFPGYAAESWFAIVGPAGMPADVVARLNEAVTKAVQLPEVQKSFAHLRRHPEDGDGQARRRDDRRGSRALVGGDPRQQHPRRLSTSIRTASPPINPFEKATPCPATPTTMT